MILLINFQISYLYGCFIPVDWEMLFHIMIAMNLMPGSLFLLREAFEAFDGFDGLLYGDLVRAASDSYN